MLLLTMVYVAVFAYLKPYRSFYINILEVLILVDIMLQLTIASTRQLKVTTIGSVCYFIIKPYRIRYLKLKVMLKI